jgi:hypothetical protein
MLIRDAMGANEPKQKAAEEPDQTSVAGQSEPTSEEQEAYERVVLAGIQAMSDPASNESIMKMLSDGANDPAQALVETTAAIVIQLDEQSGGTIPEVVIIPAAAEIMSNVAEFAQQSKAFIVDDNLMGRSTQMLVLRLVDEYGGDPEEVQQLIDSMDQQEMQGMVEQQQQYAAGGPQATPEGGQNG